MTERADSIMIKSMMSSITPDNPCNPEMLCAVRGEPCGNIPWAPRMDLWYIALRERGIE
jgi:hypothetical protein